MVLGKLPVPGRPTIWITVGQGPTALAVGAGGGCMDIFTLIYPFSPLSPSLWETARYRLKYCLKGPLNPKQTKKNTEPPLFRNERWLAKDIWAHCRYQNDTKDKEEKVSIDPRAWHDQPIDYAGSAQPPVYTEIKAKEVR